MGAVVKIGVFGDNKKLMKILSKRDSHIDLEFICGTTKDVLKCHRFIIGAQSSFLRGIMESLPESDGRYQIFLPDVEKSHMEVVLQFLYTGKMRLHKKMFNPIRDLLAKVIRIDAEFNIPEEPLLSLPRDNPSDDHDEGGNGSNGQGHGDQPTPPSSDSSPDPSIRGGGSKEPPKKRFRPSSDTGPHNKEVLIAPMSPPHDLEASTLDEDEIRVITPPPKTPPPLVDLSDNEEEAPPLQNSQDDTTEETGEKEAVAHEIDSIIEDYSEVLASPTNEEEQSRSEIAQSDSEATREAIFETLRLAPAPKIIAKHTGVIKKSTQNAASSDVSELTQRKIPTAPKVVAKRTGKRGRPSKTNVREPSPNVEDEILEDTNPFPSPQPEPQDEPLRVENNDHDSTPSEIVEPAPSTSTATFCLDRNLSLLETTPSSSTRTTRSSTGALKRTNFSEIVDDDDDDFMEDDLSDPTFNGYISFNGAGSNSNVMDLPPLPPPLPQAPEEGVELYRGQWMKSAKVERYKAKIAARKVNASSKPRQYHPNTESITGRSLPEVAKFRNEEVGIHQCPECPAAFEISRSLHVHISREHNPNATVECPEGCGKRFTSKGAIRKHLLSHRPEEEWPFICLFCGKHFQARADLPKHFKTSRHKNDPRIPEPYTPEWEDLMKRSEIVPMNKITNRHRSSSPIVTPRSISPCSNIAEASSPPQSPPPTLERVLTENDANIVASAIATTLNDSTAFEPQEEKAEVETTGLENILAIP